MLRENTADIKNVTGEKMNGEKIIKAVVVKYGDRASTYCQAAVEAKLPFGLANS